MNKPKRTFVAVSNQKDLLAIGKHLVKISSIAEVTSKAKDEYKDRTPQYEVKFENKQGFITGWYNLMGYERDPQTGEYAINPKTGERIENAENTAAAISIFQRLAVDAGIPTGTEFEAGDLVGLELGIMVKASDNGQLTVHYSMPAAKATAESTEVEA